MNQTFRFALIDAFTDRPLAGNPCAVVLDADGLSDQEMLKIAKEMNQSETAFLMSSKSASFKLRFFTPETEIPLAGHPTIAAVHAALEAGVISSTDSGGSITIELIEGPISVELIGGKQQMFIRMNQRSPIFGEIHQTVEVLPLFGLTEDDLIPGFPIQTVSTGTRQLMIPLRSHDSLRKLKLHPELYLEYRSQHDFFSPHAFCLYGVSADAATFARHLGVYPDTPEDAFTGSATGGMAAYLWKYGLIEKPTFIAEQGHWMGRPGRAFVEVRGPRDKIESVIVGGSAVTVLTGTLKLPMNDR